MSRATRLVQQSQPVQSQPTPEISQTTAVSGAPAMPRGQMPIEEVFKMMWARMNFLENALKESPSTNVTTNEDGVTTISDLQGSPTNQVIQPQVVVPSYDESILEEIKSTIAEHDAKITTLAQEIGGLKKSLSDTISNFNNSMQAVGADLTEMNNKYTQMNNFLMEIQTTQITVNNQILKHYNDNYSDLIESQVTQSADEKFNSKDVEEATNNEGNTEESSVTTETATVTATLEETTNTDVQQETVVPVENAEPTETKKNNVTFNIE